jgi:hypothetical protein
VAAVSSPAANSWNHLLAMLDVNADSADIDLYVNNSLIGSFVLPIDTSQTISTLDIGRRFSAYFNGDIDNVRIYDRLLDNAERSELFNE